MSQGGAERRRGQAVLLRRLRAMGLEARALPGGRCVVATLRPSRSPFATLRGPRRIERVRLASVGPAHLKCLEPEALFQLPILPIAGCGSAADLEAKIRDAARARQESLRRARSELGARGVETEPDAEGALLAFGFGDEDPSARVRCVEPRRLVLPGRGTLSGLALESPEERCFRPEPGGSAVDLELAVASRLETLAARARRAAERRRLEQVRASGGPSARPAEARHRLLLVGPRLAADRSAGESLRLRGYDVRVAAGLDAALSAFRERSFEAVLCDAVLGRDEGLELVPALHGLPGVERVPVVLVDDRDRPGRREAARRVGAAGYLVHPLDVPRIAPGLARMVASPRRRRFRRYARPVAVHWPGAHADGVATAIGRMGMFVRTERESPVGAVEGCELFLPELGERLRVEAEILYRAQGAGQREPGLGLRFRGFPDGNEAALIAYLDCLD